MNLRQIVPALVSLLITGCAAHVGADVITTTAPPPASASPVDLQPTPANSVDLTAVNTADPDAVALAVVSVLNKYDTRTDPGPVAAARRAGAVLVVDALVGAVSAPTWVTHPSTRLGSGRLRQT